VKALHYSYLLSCNLYSQIYVVISYFISSQCIIFRGQMWLFQPSPSLRNERTWWTSVNAIWIILWESWWLKQKRDSISSPCWHRLTWQCGPALLLPFLWWVSWSFCSDASSLSAPRIPLGPTSLLLSRHPSKVPSGSSTEPLYSKVSWVTSHEHEGWIIAE